MTDDMGAAWRAAMFAGDFEAAWRVMDQIEAPRRAAEKAGAPFQREVSHLLWNGAPFDKKRVLVCCKDGLGDSIQFARYLTLMRERANRVILKAQPALLRLFQNLAGVDELIDAWSAAPDPPHDVAIDIMELPYAFRSTVETLPAATPYLTLEQISAHAAPLDVPQNGDLRAGLVWASAPRDSSRSVTLSELAPLAEVDGVTFFSLQQGAEAEALTSASFPIIPLSERTRDPCDAAAAMLALDLIISVDSMPVHLAGALGRPVWTLLKHEADWRWMRTQDWSSWYPSMRLFRQPATGSWPPVIGCVREALCAAANGFRRGETALLYPSR